MKYIGSVVFKLYRKPAVEMSHHASARLFHYGTRDPSLSYLVPFNFVRFQLDFNIQVGHRHKDNFHAAVMSISKQKVDTLFPATVDIQRMAPQHASRRIRSRILTIFLVGLILWATLSTAQYFNLWSPQDTPKSSDICPQADVLVPQKNAELWNKLGGTIGTEGFKARAVDWLSGAVKLP